MRVRMLYHEGRFAEAIPMLQAVAQRLPQDIAIQTQLAWSYFHTGNSSAAARVLQASLEQCPDDADATFAMGVVLGAQGKHMDAMVHLNRTSPEAPNHFDALVLVAGVQMDANDPAGAEATLRRALEMYGNRAAAWTNLGVVYARQDRYEEARQAFERAADAETTRGEDVGNFINLATNLHAFGRTQDEIAVYERGLPDSQSPHAYANYAHSLLTIGRLREGWTYYEFRWLMQPLVNLRPPWRKPVWAGQDLRGKTILLRIEQGFGDTIQLLRYAPHLQRLGAMVLLRVGPGFEHFACGFAGVDRVLGQSDANPHFDFYIHLLSLPRVFGTDLDSIPVPATLALNAISVAQWSRRFDRAIGAKIGLVWAGSAAHVRDRQRSVPLRTLVPLAQVSGASFHALQIGPAAAELVALAGSWPIDDLAADIKDFSDTAAAIAQLDLVICVDTAVAHLAATLCKPVWLMVTRVADWRWLENRDDSPWYPSVRLFRQRADGDWAEVVERVRDALRLAIEAGDFKSPSPRRSDVALVPPPACLPRNAPGHRPGFGAVSEARMGIVQFLPDDGPHADAIGWYGEWLQPQLDLLGTLMAPGSTALEIDAGVGIDAIALAAIVGAAGHLILIEPRHLHRRILQQNLAANGIANATIIRRALLGLRPVVADERAHESSMQSTDVDGGAGTVDELAIERLDWIKIGEAADAATIVNGASDTLWQRRPRVFIRVGSDAALAQAAAAIGKFGYRCWRVDTPWFNPGNFNRRLDDIFDGRKALAMLAIPEEIDIDIPLPGCVDIH